MRWTKVDGGDTKVFKRECTWSGITIHLLPRILQRPANAERRYGKYWYGRLFDETYFQERNLATPCKSQETSIKAKLMNCVAKKKSILTQQILY